MMMSNDTETVLEFSPKQLEYIRSAKKRWNSKIGATQCGKTFVDVSWTIPFRILERKGKPGLVFILGVSKGSLQRNIIQPLQERWGSKLITDINSQNESMMFGETVYCLGTEKSSQVAKIRGARIKYLYWDEICEANEEVVELTKSRMSLPYSMCDFTGNPKNPTHFIKKFIDRKDLDIYVQNWTLYDNPFLPTKYIHELEKEYEGTIYFDRYILGQWKRAEGIIYRKFADNPNEYIINTAPPLIIIEVGVDFGGNRSGHTFVATGFTNGFKDVVILESEKHTEQVNPEQLNELFTTFAHKIYNKYGKAFDTRYDNAEPVLGRGIEIASIRAGCRTRVKPALKTSINGRLRIVNRLLGAKRFWVMNTAKTVISAMQQAVYNSKSSSDERLDDGTSDIDTLDAMEYSLECYINDLLTAEKRTSRNGE